MWVVESRPRGSDESWRFECAAASEGLATSWTRLETLESAHLRKQYRVVEYVPKREEMGDG